MCQHINNNIHHGKTNGKNSDAISILIKVRDFQGGNTLNLVCLEGYLAQTNDVKPAPSVLGVFS